MNKFIHLGIDETTLGIGENSSIVVAAETTSEKLIQDLGYNSLKKSKDILREYLTNPKISFTPYKEMLKKGLTNFHWTRARAGRFNLKSLQHAAIANVIKVNGYKPNNTIIYIDAFYGDFEKSKYLIKEYLDRRNFKILINHINIIGGGDRRIPIINYDDILAFQIGLNLNKKYTKFQKYIFETDIYRQEIPFDEHRVMVPIDKKGRDILEELILNY